MSWYLSPNKIKVPITSQTLTKLLNRDWAREARDFNPWKPQDKPVEDIKDRYSWSSADDTFGGSAPDARKNDEHLKEIEGKRDDTSLIDGVFLNGFNYIELLKRKGFIVQLNPSNKKQKHLDKTFALLTTIESAHRECFGVFDDTCPYRRDDTFVSHTLFKKYLKANDIKNLKDKEEKEKAIDLIANG